MIWNNLLRCCWIDNTMETWKIIKKKRAKNSFLNQCMNRQKGLDKWKSTQHIKWCGYTTTRKILDYTDILISCIWISIYLLRGAMNVGSWKDVEIYKRLHFHTFVGWITLMNVVSSIVHSFRPILHICWIDKNRSTTLCTCFAFCVGIKLS